MVRDLTVLRLNRKWRSSPSRRSEPSGSGSLACGPRSSAPPRHGSPSATGRHIAFTTPPADKTTAGTGAAVGIDRGVANTVATSEGQMIQAPSHTKEEQARFVRLQQRLSRQLRD